MKKLLFLLSTCSVLFLSSISFADRVSTYPNNPTPALNDTIYEVNNVGQSKTINLSQILDKMSGAVTSSGGTTSINNVIPANKGGAGTINGILKANGSGTVSQATANSDYLTPSNGDGRYIKRGGDSIPTPVGTQLWDWYASSSTKSFEIAQTATTIVANFTGADLTFLDVDAGANGLTFKDSGGSVLGSFKGDGSILSSNYFSFNFTANGTDVLDLTDSEMDLAVDIYIIKNDPVISVNDTNTTNAFSIGSTGFSFTNGVTLTTSNFTYDGISWGLSSANLKLTTVGKGLYIKEGSNATMGTATLVGGTKVVNTTKVTANSRIFLTAQSLGTVTVGQGLGVSARTAGTSFTILSTSAVDTSTVAWLIVEPS